MIRSSRLALTGLAVAGLVAAFVVRPSADPTPLNAAPATVAPLDRVPADAGLVVHFRAGDLWNHPAVNEIKKAYGKELEPALKSVKDETGLTPDQIDTVTFHWPKIPMGPGDEAVLMLQITTKTPYDQATVLKGLRAKESKAVDGVVKLRDQMVLHLTSETQFTVLHESLLEEFKKGKSKIIDGLQADALKAARAGKHALVAGFDPSGLPPEVFTAAPPELQPFLPLLQSKSIILRANLGKELTASVQFSQQNEEKAIDAERAFNLLMKLADDAITTALTENKDEELKALAPALGEVQKVVKKLAAKRHGTDVLAEAALPADPALARPIAGMFLRPQMAAGRARSQNNLKQIGLALHNYHDVHGVLPPAAICDKKGKPLLSWRVAILPYIEQDNVYRKFKLDEPWDSPTNKKLSDTIIKTYVLPYGDGERKQTHTNYRVFVGNGAAFDTIQGFKLEQFTDGTSNTMMVFEAAESTPWAKPDEIEFDPKKPLAKHLRFENNGVCNILMADGSVRAISSKITEEILRLLIQKDDGMPIPDLD